VKQRDEIDMIMEERKTYSNEYLQQINLDTYRPLLFTYAYNILGVVEEAEDIVQDAFIRIMSAESGHIHNPRAYLTKTVINLAINRKKRQKRLLLDYPGEWLPEPVSMDDTNQGIERKEILSYSLMVLLERLNPKQRAVFILKEAFNYDHTEIAEVINIKEENSRQLLTRAKKLVMKEASASANTSDHNVLQKYLQVIKLGDIKQLEELLRDDIMVVSDGGGKASAGKHPVCGRRNAMSMLLGLYRKFYTTLRFQYKIVNHQHALLYFDGETLTTCQIISIENGQVNRVFFLRNPDKLKKLYEKLN
jgi:RNA polymerase sigma factor (sigma-70 family)